jgi:hypothetical protein
MKREQELNRSKMKRVKNTRTHLLQPLGDAQRVEAVRAAQREQLISIRVHIQTDRALRQVILIDVAAVVVVVVAVAVVVVVVEVGGGVVRGAAQRVGGLEGSGRREREAAVERAVHLEEEGVGKKRRDEKRREEG